MAQTKVTSNEIKASSGNLYGTTSSQSLGTSTFDTVVTQVIPTTAVAHKYAITFSPEVANNNGGSYNELAAVIHNSTTATQLAIQYNDCAAGTWFCSWMTQALLSTTGATIQFKVFSQLASRSVTNRGTWMILDLGEA